MAYSQNDPAWKNTHIGFDTGAGDTLGNYGCYMTAIANVCQWAGHDYNPAQINELCKQNGWLARGDLIARDDIPALLCNNLQFAGRTNWNDAVSMNFFADASSPDVAYIICIDASKAPGIQTHFVMVWSKLGDHDLEIEDSWDGLRKPLSHYGNPSIIIQSAIKFVKTAPAAPPPPPVAVPAPEPVPAPAPAPPAGAAPYPAPNESYTLVVDVPAYVTSNGAANHLSASGTVKAGNYAIFNKKLDKSGKLIAINVTSKPGTAGSWINPDDNHEPVPEPAPAPKNSGWLGPREDGAPAPTPPLEPVVRESQVPKKPSEVPIGTQADNTWKSNYKALNLQNRSEEYELVQPWTMKEYSGKKNPVPLAQGTKLNITGTFTKNGVKFYRTRSARDEFFAWWYAIPAVDDNGRAVLVKLPPEPAQPTDNYLTLQDVAYYLKSDLSRLKIWDVIRGKKVNK